MAKYKNVGPNDDSQGVYDNETGWFIPPSTDNRMWRHYLEWVAEGNTADPWKTTAELLVYNQGLKRTEIEQELERRIDVAEDGGTPETPGSQPTDKLKLEFDRRKRKARQQAQASAMAGESTLTQDKKDQAKNDQKFSEWQEKVTDDAYKGIDAIMKMSDPALVEAYDAVTDPPWTTWVPPV